MFLLLLAAEGTTTPAAAGGMAQLYSLLPLVLLFVFMWFILIRPQKKQQEAHRKMLGALKKGDRVVTAGGIVGEIVALDDDEVRLRVAEKVEMRFVKSSVSRLIKD